MKRVGIGLAVLLLAGLGVLFLTPFGKALRDLASRGVIQNLASKPPERVVSGDTVARLKALRTALDLYHDSEERYPEASGWSEAARLRLKADDLAKGQDRAALTRPGARAYGYALNARAAGKYRDDVGPESTILLYETARETKDAVGDPARDGLKGGRGITVSGEIVALARS